MSILTSLLLLLNCCYKKSCISFFLVAYCMIEQTEVKAPNIICNISTRCCSMLTYMYLFLLCVHVIICTSISITFNYYNIDPVLTHVIYWFNYMRKLKNVAFKFPSKTLPKQNAKNKSKYNGKKALRYNNTNKLFFNKYIMFINF